MSQVDRAKQFMPFDALKGLQESLRLKEYEHEKMLKSELSEEKIMQISNTLKEMKNHVSVEVSVFRDGYIKIITGRVKTELELSQIFVDGQKITFDEIQDIKIL